MAIHADLGLAYVVFELESYVGVYSIDAETGALEQKEVTRHFVPALLDP